MIERIESISFENVANEYLDVVVNNEENFITLNLETSSTFGMSEKDFEQFVKAIRKVFKNMNQNVMEG